MIYVYVVGDQSRWWFCGKWIIFFFLFAWSCPHILTLLSHIEPMVDRVKYISGFNTDVLCDLTKIWSCSLFSGFKKNVQMWSLQIIFALQIYSELDFCDDITQTNL